MDITYSYNNHQVIIKDTGWTDNPYQWVLPELQASGYSTTEAEARAAAKVVVDDYVFSLETYVM